MGDAGHHKDFLLGDGMSEALLQAKALGAAILEGGARAMTRCWRERDARAVELFRFGQDLAVPATPMERLFFQRLGGVPDASERFGEIFDRKRSPFELVPVPTIVRWTLAAALHGRLNVLPGFLQQGRRASMVKKEQQAMQRLVPA